MPSTPTTAPPAGVGPELCLRLLREQAVLGHSGATLQPRRLACAQGRQQRIGTLCFKARGQGFVSHALAVRDGCGRVKLDQYLPLPNRLAIPHMNRLDDSRFHRLDNFRSVVGDNLADRCRNDIDAAEGRPEQSDQRKPHDEPEGDTRGRVDRGVSQSQRGGQKLCFVCVQCGRVGFLAKRPRVTKDFGVTLEQIG